MTAIFNMDSHIKNCGHRELKMFEDITYKIEETYQNSEEWKFEENPLAVWKYIDYINIWKIDRVTAFQKRAFKV